MPIQFARMEMVKRSAGKNACYKAAYNGGLKITCEKTNKTYFFGKKQDSAFHKIFLPSHVDKKFEKAEILWNEAENRENRINSQVAKEVVLALPDQSEITLQDKIAMACDFAVRYFVNEGLAAQVDIHSPNKNDDHNWHAHILITTRRFDETGRKLNKKARDLDAKVCKGHVVEGKRWGELWKDFQHEYFRKNGIELTVDPTGIVAQKHMGPVRLRAKPFELIENHEKILKANYIKSIDPSQILEKVTEKQNVFTSKDVEAFIKKHIPSEKANEVKELFWKQSSILQLLGSKSNQVLDKYTTKEIREEELRILRLSNRISEKMAYSVKEAEKNRILENSSLTKEQREAFDKALQGSRFFCIQGDAGTGKSFLLKTLGEAYHTSKYEVRGFAPTNEAVKDLKKNGFEKAETLHRLLFKNQQFGHEYGRKEIWFVDEAGMIDNHVMQEFLSLAWKKNNQVVLVGDKKQLPPIARGGMFKIFCQKYKTASLTEIQRQEKKIDQMISSDIAQDKISDAIDQLHNNKAIFWEETKERAMFTLVDKWFKDQELFPDQSFFIIEHRNSYARALNELIREKRLEKQEISRKAYKCDTFLGESLISIGDRIQFRSSDKKLRITNGLSGTLVAAEEERFIVRSDENEEITFNPKVFDKYQLGYAGTYHRSQGKTVDRAYVMHSPWINKNFFYVGMTRHRKNCFYFVSKDEVSDLSALKYQINRSGEKESSLEFKIQEDLKENQQTSSFNKLWRRLKYNVLDSLHKDSDFYKFKTSSDNFSKHQVVSVELKPLEYDQNITDYNPVFANLDKHKENLFVRYFSLSYETIYFTKIQNQELKEKDNPEIHSDRIRTEREKCKCAHMMLRTYGKNKIHDKLGKNASEFIEKDAFRYEEPFKEDVHEINNRKALNDYLLKNIDTLCFRLFPNAQAKLKGEEIKLCNEASLTIHLAGSKKGQFQDFSNDKKGDLISLVSYGNKLDEKEAEKWCQNFIKDQKEIPESRKITKHYKGDELWTGVFPNKKELDFKVNEDIFSYFTLTEKFIYKNLKGEIVSYSAYFQNKEEPSKSILLPISYGFFKEKRDIDASWQVRYLKNSCRNLYNADLLPQNPKSPVMILSDEITVAKAEKMFPDHISITWQGDIYDINKADWSSLKGRRAVIWSSNDIDGQEMTNMIKEELKKRNLVELKVIDSEVLKSKLPENWSLTDPLPPEISPKFLDNMILLAPTVHLERSNSEIEKPHINSKEVELKLSDLMNTEKAMQSKQKEITQEGNSKEY